MVCQIILEKTSAVFAPGDEVKGIAKYTLSSAKTVRGVKIKITGRAHTEWTTTEEYRDGEETKRRTITLTGDENYIYNKYYLVGSSNSEITIPAGVVNYPFRFVLPQHIPSSFSGSYGYISYGIKLILDLPWQFDDEEVLYFKVITPLDLNADYQLSQPQHVEFHKTFCCMCCASGPLYIIIKIPVSGYIPGQTIPILAECDNASNVDVDVVTVTLRRKEYFSTHTPKSESKFVNHAVQRIVLGSCKADGSQNWSRKLTIPPQPPSNLKNCGIINVTYDLHVCAEVTGPHTNLKNNISVTIGTIPLISFNSPAETVTDVSQPNPTAPLNNLGWNVANANDSSGAPSAPLLAPIVHPPALPPLISPQIPFSQNQPDSSAPALELPSAPALIDGLPSYPGYSATPVTNPADDLPPPTYDESQKTGSCLPPGYSPSAPPPN